MQGVDQLFIAVRRRIAETMSFMGRDFGGETRNRQLQSVQAGEFASPNLLINFKREDREERKEKTPFNLVKKPSNY
jgi:hypothetical protein